MRKLAASALVLIVLTCPAQAQTPCDIAGGAVRLHLTSEACKLSLSDRGKAALAAAQNQPTVMACMRLALGRIQAEVQEAIELGGNSGVKLWCDLQQQTLSGMLE